MELDGKVAVVTAAGSGMGRASVRRFAQEGATVVAVDVDPAGVEATVEAVAGAGGRAEAVVMDATDVGALGELLGRVERDQGRLDVMFCHVGGASPHMELDFDPSDFDHTVAINLRGGVFGAVLAAPLMARGGGGSIILTSSAAALHGEGPVLYGMAKAGVVQYAKSLAVRLGRQGIRANAILPGPILTPALRGYLRVDEPGGDERAREYAADIPLGRLGTPEDVAELAVFLASDRSSFINGAALTIDGGLTARGYA
jgi:NAD(P)-dependent dehydrogenase (short-subunit alcohol dehydrogenase family)